MTLNGIVAPLWHNSISGLIFAAKFEICILDLLFDYEVWRSLRQVLCVFVAKKTASVMKTCQILGVKERAYSFLVDTPKGTLLAAGNTRFGIQIVEIGQETRPVGVMNKAKKKEKKVKDVANCLFVQTTHIELPPPKFSCAVGSCTWSYISRFIEIGSGVSAPPGGGQNPSFSYSTTAYTPS